MKKLTLMLFLLNSFSSWARNGSGGGDIVGNGGGLGEQNFIYALTHLPEFVLNTLQNDTLPEDQKRDLDSILHIAFSQHLKSNKLKFISEKTNPGFFTSDTDPEVRLAKTDFFPESLIYVNLDLIYQRDAFGDVEILPMPIMVASLVHEFGHQIGIKDHHYLDLLGARVRRMIERGSSQLKIKWQDKELAVNTISLGPTHDGLLNYKYQGKLVSLNIAIKNAISCKSKDEQMIGFTFENQHFADVFEGYENVIIPFKSWVQLSCINSKGNIHFEKGMISIVFLVDLLDQQNAISTLSVVFGPI
ncbi:MAG: hypothetical protein OHK0056_13820 [Bacteriovoracaceae bacterium]